LGYTFLPCVLVGLSRAPQFITTKTAFSQTKDMWAEQVDAVVVPATACGGSAILSFSQSKAQIIAVQENKTQMQVPPEQLGIKALRVNSYLEALGVLVAHRAGISPSALKMALSSIMEIQ
jgi:Asp-tRNA(Asn)/Glu-tRNA(Gln) amidotransferase A subunit family amidase